MARSTYNLVPDAPAAENTFEYYARDNTNNDAPENTQRKYTSLAAARSRGGLDRDPSAAATQNAPHGWMDWLRCPVTHGRAMARNTYDLEPDAPAAL